MSSTITRPARSLNVPSTQNTAPVLDFRCLYTYDLRRKAKRWQDGLARFHTFNKRVMVYDESRNFIGDTHWREPEPIQDGDELQLDKGILIQIGEATGKTDQDISGLFEKRKAAPVEDGNTSPATTRRPQVSSPREVRVAPTATSQLMPRTLNSVLGTPKVQLGRAALPAKSPFELRHADGTENGIEKRAAKRQRVSYPGVTTTLSSPASCVQAPSKRARSEVQPVDQEAADNGAIGCRDEVDVPTGKSANKPLNGKTVPRQQKGWETAKNPKVNGAPKERNLGPAGKKAPAPTVRLQDREVNRSDVINADSSGRSEPSEEPISQGSRLRIVSSKPRKKLMYRDLLPQARQTTKAPSDYHALMRKEKMTEEPIALEKDPLSQYHHEERDRLRARLERHERRGVPSVHVPDEPEVVDVETLFVTPDDCTHGSHGVENDGKTIVIGVHSKHQTRPHRRYDTLGEHVDDDNPSPPKYLEAPFSSKSELARMDALLLHHNRPPPQEIQPPKPIFPPKPQANIPSKAPFPPAPALSRPKLTRPIPPQPPPPPDSKVTTNNSLKRSLSTVITSTTATPTQQTSKRSLRKTVSDTATLASGAKQGSLEGGLRLPAASVEAAPDPWSSEAWDLFGWRREDFVQIREREGGKAEG